MTYPLGDIPVRNDLQTIAFYNVENLFDVFDDQRTNDNDFLSTSVKKWTKKRYGNKLRKLGYTISNIGKKETGKHPALIGIAEVESANAIEDLIASAHLNDCSYKYIHYDSLDERGIDVALLYDATVFQVLDSEIFRVDLLNEANLPDYTRDILLVSGLLDGEKIHVIVNHWSSRREGEKETEFKRLASSNKVGELISKIKHNDAQAKIVVVGDFNDDPSSLSIKQLVDAHGLFNPMETLRSYSRGSSNYNRQWNLFDQILFSTNFFESTKTDFEYFTADIFDANFLKLMNGKYKGTPFRTYIGKRYNGGYSDHFPVYAIFKK
ncbi:endonuclease/exonuclease/phosphatase family protein [Changchengzhania lutea]|uniref:endonuclease/exonuclease/phosphatase family protein n=1 Tax=Changchengzhania lutea TaxID=2049305 RepID=UPI00115F6B45|nr:endonuclease [Changchengzhania lutea]